MNLFGLLISGLTDQIARAAVRVSSETLRAAVLILSPTEAARELNGEFFTRGREHQHSSALLWLDDGLASGSELSIAGRPLRPLHVRVDAEKRLQEAKVQFLRSMPKHDLMRWLKRKLLVPSCTQRGWVPLVDTVDLHIYSEMPTQPPITPVKWHHYFRYSELRLCVMQRTTKLCTFIPANYSLSPVLECTRVHLLYLSTCLSCWNLGISILCCFTLNCTSSHILLHKMYLIL